MEYLLSCTEVSTHPVLRRHYGTIGIGDVFVEQNMEWKLPRMYFSAPGKAPQKCRNSPHDVVDRHFRDGPVSDADSTQCELLDEMVGTIKQAPEDFVVREMAVVQGVVRVADLSLKESLEVSSTPEPATGSTTSLLPIPDKKPPLERRVEPQVDNDVDPLKQLQSVIQKYHIMVVASDTTAIDAVSALSALENEALRMLSLTDRPLASSNPALHLSFTLTDSSDISQQKMDKREIHDALRNAFPLLIATSGNGSTTISENALSPDGTTITRDGATSDGSTIRFDNQCAAQDMIRVAVDDCFWDLAPYLFAPDLDLPPLYAFAKRGYEYSQTQANKVRDQERSRTMQCQQSSAMVAPGRSSVGRRRALKPGPTIRLRPDLPRDERRPIHQAIDAKSRGLLGTETLKDFPLMRESETLAETDPSATTTTTAILVHWTSVAARKESKKRSREEIRDSGEAPSSKFLLCVIRKRKKEHLALINTLSAVLHCRPAAIGLAGIKDYNAVAFQFCTLENFESPQRVLKSTEALLERGIEIVPLQKVDCGLNKGDLLGNHFDIVVRNMQRVQLSFDPVDNTPIESFVPVDEHHVAVMVRRVQASGFVNFYGEQRVGEPGHESIAGVRAFDIGRAMLQKDFAKAIDMLVLGRRLWNGVEAGDEDVDPFRRVWKETGGDPIATAKHLPQGMNAVPRERAVLKGLIRYGRDQQLAALRCLQRNERLFFINGVRAQLGDLNPVSFSI
jgi:TruD family tRNA pseudouridine synthase